MNNKKSAHTFLVVAISLVLLFACNNNSSLSVENVVNVDPAQNERILLSEIIDSINYVRLETTDDILIAEITAIQYVNDCIYILDQRTNTFFSFDAITGKCLWKIQTVGRGPKEYLQIADFSIDEKENRLYLFCSVQKIIEYDLSGNFVDEYHVRLTGQSFACNGDYLYIYAGNNPNEINGLKKNYYLLIYNKTDGSLKGELFFNDNPNLWKTNIYNSPNAFYHYDDAIRFFSPYAQNIYSIRGDKMVIAYQFDFGKYNLPKNLSDYSFDELDQMPYIFGLNSCWENDRYLCATARIGTPLYQIRILYSKANQQVRVGDFFDDIAFIQPQIAQATNEFVLGYRLAGHCFETSRYSKNENSLIKKITNEMQEDDNPVIFFYYFKKMNCPQN
jgi:hypothetical protein